MHFCGKCKKSQVLLLFDFFAPVKKHGGGVGYKVNVMKLKFYWVFWIWSWTGCNRSCKMQILNCIYNLKRWFIDLNCIEIIYNLDKIYPYGVFFVRPYMRLCTMVKFCINRKYYHNTINGIKSINTRENQHSTTYKNSKILRNT